MAAAPFDYVGQQRFMHFMNQSIEAFFLPQKPVQPWPYQLYHCHWPQSYSNIVICATIPTEDILLPFATCHCDWVCESSTCKALTTVWNALLCYKHCYCLPRYFVSFLLPVTLTGSSSCIYIAFGLSHWTSFIKWAPLLQYLSCKYLSNARILVCSLLMLIVLKWHTILKSNKGIEIQGRQQQKRW